MELKHFKFLRYSLRHMHSACIKQFISALSELSAHTVVFSTWTGFCSVASKGPWLGCLIYLINRINYKQLCPILGIDVRTTCKPQAGYGNRRWGTCTYHQLLLLVVDQWCLIDRGNALMLLTPLAFPGSASHEKGVWRKNYDTAYDRIRKMTAMQEACTVHWTLNFDTVTSNYMIGCLSGCGAW